VDRVSVIIPTLNEGSFIERLMVALQTQTRPPDEVIVADAGSTDDTADRAMAAGGTVVVGPRNGPGPGRNDGARRATGDLFVFLDADVVPGPTFLAVAVAEFERRDLAVATCPMTGLSDRALTRAMVEAANNYMLALESISPRAPGWCIFARRHVHEAIGGFDESIRLAEDHDYVQRAARHGRFGVLRDVRIPVSMRRIDEEGMLHLAVKYGWCEAHAFAGIPVRHAPFDYQFGSHGRRGRNPLRPGHGHAGRYWRLQFRRARRPLRRLTYRWR
jgi:glycosyltransferase involved in cell wall biosynthesis